MEPQAARVARGGCWNNNARNCRSANRNRNTPENRNNNVGFRVVLHFELSYSLKPRIPRFTDRVSVALEVQVPFQSRFAYPLGRWTAKHTLHGQVGLVGFGRTSHLAGYFRLGPFCRTDARLLASDCQSTAQKAKAISKARLTNIHKACLQTSLQMGPQNGENWRIPLLSGLSVRAI